MLIDQIKIDFAKVLRNSWMDLKKNFWSLLVFDLYFKLFFAALLMPLLTGVIKKVISSTGKLSVSNEEILKFLFSPAGLMWMLIAGAAVLAVIFAKFGGMMLIASAGWEGKKITASSALFLIIRKFKNLLILGSIHVGCHLLVLFPFVIALGITYKVLLSGYDINYIVTVKPPVWWGALSIASVIVIGIIMANGSLYIKWILSFPVLIFEKLKSRESLKKSRQMIHEAGKKTGLFMIFFVLVMGLFPGFMTFLHHFISESILNLLPAQAIVIPLVVFLIVSYLMIYEIASLISVAMCSLIVLHVYSGLQGEKKSLLTKEDKESLRLAGDKTNKITWLVLSITLIIAIIFTIVSLYNLNLEDHVKITAHRGSSLTAPENTLSAIRQAIEDGADFAEIDVQETKDGRIILIHDEDFLRIAGVKSKVWDVTYNEIKDLDIGSWFDPKFKDERIATLEDAVRLSQGKIKLNIEIKYNGHDKKLAERVADIIKKENFVKDSLVTSLTLKGLDDIEKAAPEISTGYIVFQSIGNVEKLNVDALSIAARIASTGFIVTSQKAGKEVHVWTINDEKSMIRFINLGADNIITDHPAKLHRVLEERKKLNKMEILLLKVRTLVWD